jgi:hypothetical protein
MENRATYKFLQCLLNESLVLRVLKEPSILVLDEVGLREESDRALVDSSQATSALDTENELTSFSNAC